MNNATSPQVAALNIPPYPTTLLLAIASRCRKGLTTVADAEALEELAQQVTDQTTQCDPR